VTTETRDGNAVYLALDGVALSDPGAMTERAVREISGVNVHSSSSAIASASARSLRLAWIWASTHDAGFRRNIVDAQARFTRKSCVREGVVMIEE
jgi:hypothetical protein